MITLESTKNYFSVLKKSSPMNFMIPVIIGIISLTIFLKQKIN